MVHNSVYNYLVHVMHTFGTLFLMTMPLLDHITHPATLDVSNS